MTAKTATVLVLRTCPASMLTNNGNFKWPKKGRVVCKDWQPTYTCGHGLHGLLPGQNDPGTWYGNEPNGVWLAVKVRQGDLLTGQGDLKSKCKFRAGLVVHCGTRETVMAFLAKNECPGPWYCGTATAGDRGTATAGYGGTATAGYGGTATAGDGGTATAGDRGLLLIKHWDGNRYRMKIAYVGEDNITEKTPYRLNSEGEFVEAK